MNFTGGPCSRSEQPYPQPNGHFTGERNAKTPRGEKDSQAENLWGRGWLRRSATPPEINADVRGRWNRTPKPLAVSFPLGVLAFSRSLARGLEGEFGDPGGGCLRGLVDGVYRAGQSVEL